MSVLGLSECVTSPYLCTTSRTPLANETPTERWHRKSSLVDRDNRVRRVAFAVLTIVASLAMGTAVVFGTYSLVRFLLSKMSSGTLYSAAAAIPAGYVYVVGPAGTIWTSVAASLGVDRLVNGSTESYSDPIKASEAAFEITQAHLEDLSIKKVVDLAKNGIIASEQTTRIVKWINRRAELSAVIVKLEDAVAPIVISKREELEGMVKRLDAKWTEHKEGQIIPDLPQPDLSKIV